ncbi:hypothetical protein ACLKA6_003753 [Drosophila palustris]
MVVNLRPYSFLIISVRNYGLELAKWNTSLNGEASEFYFKVDSKDITKALGMSWQPKRDTFCFRYDLPVNLVTTKRTELSVTACLYDLLDLYFRLFVEHLHRQHLHAGAKVLMALLRQQVWIVNVRQVARKVVRRCIHCYHYKPRLMNQIMSALPATVFVFFSSKAVHVELISDLSTNNFVLCLKRFIGRRGIPQRIYCDNATNFVGAQSQLDGFKAQFFGKHNELNLKSLSSNMGFEFHFIPPRAPHFGGLWEAAVKSMKTLLIKQLTSSSFTYEELQTIAVEAEAILNSRPISALGEDPNDGEALTPGHLLIGSSMVALPEATVDDSRPSYLTRWQRVTYLTLQLRSKWLNSEANIEPNQVVLVHEDNLPPQEWLLGRIISTHAGTDGRVRVADVKTKKGTICRPICKLAPLPNQID